MAINAVDDGIPTIVAAEALGQLRANSVMANLVRRDFDDEVAMYGQTVQVQKRGTVSVSTISHPTTADVTFEMPADANKSVTLNQHKAALIQIEDFYKALNRPNILDGYGEDSAIVISDTVEAFLLTTIAEGGSTVSTGNTDVTVANVLAADKTLSVNRAPRGMRYAVWHPRAKEKLIQKGVFIGHEITTNVAVSVQDGDPAVRMALNDAVLGRRFGFDHFEDQNVPLYNSSSNTQANVLFQKEACTLASRPLPAPPNGAGAVSTVVMEAGFAIRSTLSWQPRRVACELILDFLYGASLFRPEFVYSFATSLS